MLPGTEELAPGEHILFSCSGVTDGELLRGVVIVELFTAKGTGPGRAQDLVVWVGLVSALL